MLELRRGGVPSLLQGLAMLWEQAARTPKGQWVRVIGGWSAEQFVERRLPTVAELNAAAPDTPVFVLHLSGPMLPQLADALPDQKVIDRTTMNTWEDLAFVEAVKATGRKKLVIAGLWTEVCIVLPVLSVLAQGYEVYVVTDASGGVTPRAHEHAIQRMIQAGAVPVTCVEVLLELQRDRARAETYGAVMDVVKENATGSAAAGSRRSSRAPTRSVPSIGTTGSGCSMTATSTRWSSSSPRRWR